MSANGDLFYCAFIADKFQNKYRIPSARLSTWDYSSNGSYFITICKAKRQHNFGEIINEEMQLSNIGKKAHECWLDTPNHVPYVSLDAFVMPKHIHGIIVIDKPGNDFTVTNCGTVVETGRALSLQREPK